MNKKYVISFNTYIDCLLNKDFKSSYWNISDLLILKTNINLLIITINENYEPVRHFLNGNYDNYIDSIKLSKRIDEINTLRMWKGHPNYKHYKIYNITNLIKDNILDKNCIDTFLETKDKIIRNMITEIIINKLNNLNNGNN